MTELVAGRPTSIAADVVRYIAPNPGMMTGPGTNGYLIGRESLTMIDPGPAKPEHVDALVAYADGRLDKILVTHTHRDHSPAAMALAERTGATVYGMLPPATPENDQHFVPDVVIDHDQVISCGEHEIQALHTPGHASNHVCFLLRANGMLFTGDHIMNGSTVVIAAPDGNMREYLASLEMLKRYEPVSIAPGHGAVLDDPIGVIDWIVAHRLEREAKVRDRFRQLAPCTVATLLPSVYDEVDPRLLPIARYSLIAHLEKLREDGEIEVLEDEWHWVGQDDVTP
ncbi:MAG: MBL fold metallo-hydrolase [Pseudomonadota bacterium]